MRQTRSRTYTQLICDTFHAFETLADVLAFLHCCRVEPTERCDLLREEKHTATVTGLART
jgi:hypothetical protein